MLIAPLLAQPLDINNPKWKWMDEQFKEEFRIFEKNGIDLKMLATMQKRPEISFGHLLKRFQIIDRQVIALKMTEILLSYYFKKSSI